MAADDWVDATDAVPSADKSWLMRADETAGDAIRAFTNAVTFGNMDRIAGTMNRATGLTNAPSYDEAVNEQVRLSEQARERSPYASIAGDVAGAVALPGFGAEMAATRMGGGALARALAYGGTGAATGAAQGAGTTYTGNVPDYVKNAAWGAAFGAPLGAVGGAAFGRRPSRSAAEIPTSPELHDISQANYGALARSGAAYEPTHLAQAANDLEQRLLAERYHWRDSPATWRAIEEMRGSGAPGQLNTGPGAIIDPAGIDFIRKGINKIPKTEATATDRASAEEVRRVLDQFIISPPAGAVLPGTEREAALAAARAREARGNWAGYKRTELVGDLIDNARNTAGATASGLNLQNELAKSARTLVKRKGGESAASKAGFNEDEINAFTNFARLNDLPGAKAMRVVDRALGGGGGLGLTVGGGITGGFGGQYFKDDPAAGAMVGLGAAGLGLGLRTLANRRALGRINELQDLIAQRNPAYEYRQFMAGTRPGAGSATAAQGVRDAAALALIRQQPQRVLIDTPSGSSDWQ